MTAVRRRAAEQRVICSEFSIDSHSKVSSPCPDSVKLGEFQQPARPQLPLKMDGRTIRSCRVSNLGQRVGDIGEFVGCLRCI